jgi:hypothetical protein
MKHADIVIGLVYVVKVSGRLAPVKVTHECKRTAYGTYASASIHGSIYGRPRTIRKFMGINQRTGRRIGPFTAAKCRAECRQVLNDCGDLIWRRVQDNTKGMLP